MNNRINQILKSLFYTIAILLAYSATSIFPADSSSVNSGVVRFIVFGDSQFGNPSEYERMIHEAEMLAPDFVIQVGDLIHGYTYNKEQLRKEWKRFKKQISPLSCTFYPVPGNHDIVTDEAEEVYAEEWGEEKLLYSFDAGPAHCIALNSWIGKLDDRIAEEQREWLKNDLEKFTMQNGGLGSGEFSKKSIFVFLHSPLWKYAENTDGRKDWELVHQILMQYPVKLVTAGHTHEYVWEERDGIDYLIINSAGVSKINEREGNFSSFLHVSVLPGGDLSYAVIKAGSILPLDTVTPDERKFASKYKISNRTIQVPDWKPGSVLNSEITVPVENPLDEKRIFKLIWDVPYGAEIQIDPFSLWVEVPAHDTVKKVFKLESTNAPTTELMPGLKIESQKLMRSGFVSREWGKKYAAQKNSETKDELQTSIKLESPVTFEGRYELFIPPIATAKKRTDKIFIDGKFDEADWKNAEPIKNLKYRSGEEAEIKTLVLFLYDENFLFVAAKMDEPNPDNLHSTAIPPIPLTWNDDDLELFFDTECSQKDYVRLFQNSAGTRFNSLQRWVPDKYFESKYKSEIVISDDAWYLEMQIPWSDIDLRNGPVPGDKWGLNIGRHRQENKIKEMIWAGYLYQPQKYGILIFK